MNEQAYAKKLVLLVIPVFSLIITNGCATRHQGHTAYPISYKKADVYDSDSQYSNNNRLAKKVKSQLSANKELNDLSISVYTSNHIVQLRGPVSNDKQKQKAVEIAQQVEGVRAVIDQLEIDENQS